MLDVFKKKKEKKDGYVWNTVFKGRPIMTKVERERTVEDRSRGTQKTVVKKFNFIPGTVGSHWRTLSKGETSDL